MQTTQIHNVTYNAATRAFEARVSISEAGEVITYPCALRGPIDMDITVASRKLADLAQRQHGRLTRPVRARRPETVLSDHTPASVSHATDALWQRMLGRAA